MKTMRRPAKHILRAALAMILVLSMLVSASVMCFAETETTEQTVVKVGIKEKGVSLGEDIIVKFYTDSTTGDGSKLVVKFNGEEYEVTESYYVEGKGNAFDFVGVTPQKLGDEMTATLYDAAGAQIGDAVTLSVKSYLEELLALSYEDSGLSQLKYQAMRELCVNMLNYGAAAQTYVDYKTDNLVNKDLSDELKALATEKITVTDTDKAVNGDAWVGAGVRFDYKLGLYFVFRAESIDEYTVTVNDKPVSEENDVSVAAYPALGENAYVIRYSGFNATNMNQVVTAKLTDANNAEQTFAYSIKSYVASKGGDTSNVANLVNATYTYGFAAVAYSAEYDVVNPTKDENGSATIVNNNGYDFSNSDYRYVELPKLSFTDYTTNTTKEVVDENLVVKTTFTPKAPKIAYSVTLESDDCIEVDGKLYSQYDCENANIENVTITRDNDAYTFAASQNEANKFTTQNPITAHGHGITFTGNIELNLAEVTEGKTLTAWMFKGINVKIGTEAAPATITANSTSTSSLATIIKIDEDSSMLVSEGSALTLNNNGGRYGIYCGVSDSAASFNTLIIDGVVTTESDIGSGDKIFKRDATKEYGFEPAIYVRKGTLNCRGINVQTLQVGSERDGYAGTVNISGVPGHKYAAIVSRYDDIDGAYVFAKGIVNTDTNTINGGVYVRVSDASLVSDLYVGSDMTISVKVNPAAGKNGYIFANTGGTATTSYTVVVNGFTPGDTNANGFFFVNKVNTNKNNSNVINLDVAIVNVGGVSHTVRIIKDEDVSVSGGVMSEKAANWAAGGHQFSECTGTSIVGGTNAKITVGENAATATLGIFGTFTQATYSDSNGTHTVWYQIIK